ncbi:hypothetical protein SELMODRAFT_82033 [Selaginella moellendorffii]|uniref:Chorein N-terminal domain-containing protein n=1 Tax=Selaginella moellendorffii TaxID=88036 RepID=D8R0G4_SELML|nr:hypothetical protein SELMODRAFT_82033 [Selaginella moellendorffii]
MLEDYVAFYLQKYLGKYVKGVSKEALKISAWQGNVELTNMQLKPEALLELKLPIKVKAGFLGSVKLKVPWSRLGQEPVIVTLDRIFVLAEPSFKQPFAIGVTLEKLAAVTVDDNGKELFVSGGALDKINKPQYRDVLTLFDNISTFNMRVEHAHYRPKVTVAEDPAAWWQYAIKATIEKNRKARTIAHTLADQARRENAEHEKEQAKKRWWPFGWGGQSDGGGEPRGLSDDEWQQLNQAIGYQEGKPSTLMPGQDAPNMLHTVLQVQMHYNASKLISENEEELLTLSCEGLQSSIRLYSEAKDFDLKLESYKICCPEGLLAEVHIDRVIAFFSSRTSVSREVAIQTAAAFQMTLDEVTRKTQQQFNEALKNRPSSSQLRSTLQVVESVSAVILRFKDEDTLENWRAHFMAIIRKLNSSQAVVRGTAGKDSKDKNVSPVGPAGEKEKLFLTGTLDELKICIAIHGYVKVEFLMRDNDMAVGAALLSLEIEDRWYGQTSPSCQSIARENSPAERFFDSSDEFDFEKTSQEDGSGKSLKSFIKAQVILSAPEATSYSNIDKQVKVSLATLAFYLNRPTLVALMDFVTAITTSVEPKSDTPQSEPGDSKDVVSLITPADVHQSGSVPMFDRKDSVVKGLLGTGKVRFSQLEFVSFNEDDDDYEGYEFSLSGQLSEVRVVYLHRFIQEISSYFLGLVPADPGYIVKLKDKVGDAEKTFLELDVLHIHVINTFQWLGGGKEDIGGIRLELISLKVENIHLVVSMNGKFGENIIKDSSGLVVTVRRTLRDLRRQLPAIDASVEVCLFSLYESLTVSSGSTAESSNVRQGVPAYDRLLYQ